MMRSNGDIEGADTRRRIIVWVGNLGTPPTGCQALTQLYRDSSLGRLYYDRRDLHAQRAVCHPPRPVIHIYPAATFTAGESVAGGRPDWAHELNFDAWEL